MQAERLVDFRARTILRILAIAIAVAIVLEVIWISRHVLAWIVISLFLALALDPFVTWIERRGRIPRAPAIGLAYLVLLLVIVAVGWTFVPRLVDEVNGLVNALPGYVHDLTHGRGRLGFLERKYHVVEKVREQVKDGGAKRLLGLSGTAIALTKGVVTVIAATVTIVFLTFFMLLEGRDWLERLYGLLPEKSQPRWRRVGHDVYRTVGGYVTGNLLISLIAGAAITIAERALCGRPRIARCVARPRSARGCNRRRDHRRRRFLPALGTGRHYRRGLLRDLPAARESRAPAGDLRSDRRALTARGARLGARRG
jgi:predicted PurR-regulated permease PerM